MTKRTNQKNRILAYLRSGKRLTGKYATNVMRIMDYRKRISELRREGYDIQSEWAIETDPETKKFVSTYKEYWLAKNDRPVRQYRTA